MTAADETWRLQRGTDSECRFFQAMANQGHYRGDGTRQGIYACAASGAFLGSVNSLSPDEVLPVLEGALERWGKLAPAVRRLGADVDVTPAHRWEDSYPAEGLVLVSTNRDLPTSGGPDSARSPHWNRDHVWFSMVEARSLLPAKPEVGDRHRVLGDLVERLARFHVVDNVRGQTVPFAEAEVAGSEIHTEVIGIEGRVVRLRIMGNLRAESRGTWLMGENDWKPSKANANGIRTRLLGHATYDLGRRRFTVFEVVALGERWGFTENNGRHSMRESTPIGFVFSLAKADDRIAPAFIDVYYTGWVKRPGTP